MTIFVSVVVPTYHRPDLLRLCLEALLAQDFAPDHYEVIVADDGPSDGTRRLVEEMAHEARSAIRYIAVTGRHGPAAARNAGWRVARGEVIAFTDDDCLPDPGWLSAGTATFEDGVAAVSGRMIMPLPPVPTDYERDAAGLAERGEFVTANCFSRREALTAAGGFDETFTVAWREDSDLHFTLLERGLQVVRSPKAVVVHPVRPALWGQSIRQQRKSLFNALLFKKHPKLYRQRIQPGPPWLYYLIVVALLGIIAGVLSSRSQLAVVLAIVWLVMTMRFCLRRLNGTSRAPSHLAEMAITSAVIPLLSVYWRLRGALKFRVLFL